MRRAWVEIAIGLALLAAVAAYWVRAYTAMSAAPKSSRPALVAVLKGDFDRAVQAAALQPRQQKQLADARATLREAGALRGAGKAVDPARMRAASRTLETLLSSGAFRDEDRRQIARDRKALRALDRQEMARDRQALRAAFVQQLGLPLGLLADLAAKNL